MEQELRSQISSLSSTERGIRSEMGQLRQENELLQNKYVRRAGLRSGARRPHRLWLGAQDLRCRRDLARGVFDEMFKVFNLVLGSQHIIKSIKTYYIATSLLILVFLAHLITSSLSLK